ncbi:MAG: hypothetical protein GZ094_19155 [Mariniphaga sp.]|nr:hypothetical protein [Mariniphaga sp.]
MKYKTFILAGSIIIFLTSFVSAQSTMTTGNKYLLNNGKPTFINGANYSPSTGWFQILDNWNPAAIEKDMDSLHSIGVDFIRFMPLWCLYHSGSTPLFSRKVYHLVITKRG